MQGVERYVQSPQSLPPGTVLHIPPHYTRGPKAGEAFLMLSCVYLKYGLCNTIGAPSPLPWELLDPVSLRLYGLPELLHHSARTRLFGW